VSHTDPEILALRALGEAAGTVGDEEHTRTCAHCRAELVQLTGVVALARQDSAAGHLEQPPPRVWERIAAAAGDGTAPPLAVPPAIFGGLADGQADDPPPEARGEAGGRAGGMADWPRGSPAWPPG
jgi:hypothetical protein